MGKVPKIIDFIYFSLGIFITAMMAKFSIINQPFEFLREFATCGIFFLIFGLLISWCFKDYNWWKGALVRYFAGGVIFIFVMFTLFLGKDYIF
jgi:hypothetical protein